MFYRHFERLTGGQLKTRQYFNHTLATPGFDPYVRFSANSRWDDTNPWFDVPDRRVGPRFSADVRVIAGLDWRLLRPYRRRHPDLPVINLIQGVRHGDPSDPRYAYLAHHAVRVCVSQEVADAINGTGRVAGPVITIPNGLDRSSLPDFEPPSRRPIDVLIVAVKQPDLGVRLHQQLSRPGVRTELVERHVRRDDFLRLLATSRIAVLLPLRAEGFYFPALEAMALDTLVVCPDCIGNRSFCRDQQTALVPHYDDEALLAATLAALAMDDADANQMRRRGQEEVRKHDLGDERRRFAEVLTDLDRLWTT